MPKRKHRGGPSDRSPSRHSRADSPSPSKPRSAAFSTGKSWSKPAQEGHGRPSKSGKAGGDRPNWSGKPPRGAQSTSSPGPRPGRPWSDERCQRRGHRDQDGPSASHRPARPPVVQDTVHEDRPERPARPGRNQLWLYGLHAVKAALANPQRRHHRLLLTDEAAGALQTDLSNINDLRPEILAREAIARFLPPGAVHQGAALLSEPLAHVALEDVIDQAASAEKSVVVILDQVTDPQNVGAILRSAAAFGAHAVVVPDRHAPPETGALVKAASGAVEMVPLVRVVNLARAMEDLKAAGFWCAGLDGHAQQSLAAADMTGKVALVLGAEGEGLRRLTRDHCDILVRLPISDRMESLNVSAAAAVALYELARKA